MMQQNALIIFTRPPVPGKVKTRLAAAIGNEAALEVYKILLRHTQSVTQKLSAVKIVFYADPPGVKDTWGAPFLQQEQQGSNLGERMAHAFHTVFGEGYARALIIGTDCPALDECLLEEAFAQLENNDAVIGPAQDGGYYLLGLKKPCRQLFENIAWGTAAVLETTVAICQRRGIKYALLPVLPDIDEEKDLVHLKAITWREN